MANNNSSNGGKYLNGIFITQKEGQYGPYLSVGISDEGLKSLAALEKSASGFINFTATPQKNDPTKFSAKPFVPKGATANSGGSSDDLPF